jgi:hypothetical protein
MDKKTQQTVERYHMSLRTESDGVFVLSDDPYDAGQLMVPVGSISNLKQVYKGDPARLEIFSAAEKLAAEQQEKLETAI